MGLAGVETVTILITDLVGSTRLESRVGPISSAQLREEHFGLLRDAVGETGGREVKNTGDGLMVAFESAAAAVSCAVSIQQAFERRNRAAAEPLAIKVGVSVGDASVAEGDVFGMPVIEASRLCDRCSGEQILANELVAHLAAGRGHAFVSVGALELKGLAHPLDAVEVRWEPAASTGIALPERLRELPLTAYVGRSAEREQLAELWGRARDGTLRLALISGEAGVGKTRLATYLAHDVRQEGATVLYGHCDEDLGVPYQPWGQALRYLVRELPQRSLEAHVERSGAELARLVGALRDRVADLPPMRESDPETERYLLYSSVVGLLEIASEREPLLLILDDLHWADGPTLSLLRHIAAADFAARVMVVGTYRDSDLARDHPLTALLADLYRDRAGKRIRLTGLGPDEVLAFVEAAAGHELGEEGRAFAAEIARESAGNPFFAGELLRHLMESGAIVREGRGRWQLTRGSGDLDLPESVREVIGRRIDRLGPDARAALSAAAVIGRDFELDLLLAVSDLPEARLLDLLDQAVAASLLRESSEAVGRFSFAHGLVEHTLYGDLGRTRRATLHRRIAEALEEQCGDAPGERLGELAVHWSAAVVSSDTTKAIDYARRAGERALEQLAPDEAARWYRQALELHDQAPEGERSERCELLIGLGEAQRQTGDPGFSRTLMQAGQLAQELGDTDRLARAVLADRRGWGTATQFGAVDAERVQALEAAAQALPDHDLRRPQVLAQLAFELHHGGEPERCRALAAEAIEIARTCGDPATLAHTLANASAAMWATDTLVERRRVSEELTELVRQLDDPRLSCWAALRRTVVGVQSGERSQAESGLATMRTLASSVPEPLIAWTRLKLEATWAILQGDLQASERWATEAYELASAAGEPDAASSLGGQLGRIRSFQGRFGERAEQVLEHARQPGSLASWRAAAANALIASDRAQEARELTLAADFRSVRPDETWFMAMLLWADACSRLRVRDRADELYELLGPCAGQFVAGGTVVSGSVDWALGTLAGTLELHEDAERHFAAAVELEERLGAPLYLARTRVDWSRALITRGRPQDIERARDMLAQAEEAAGPRGAAGITREVVELRGALAPEGAPVPHRGPPADS